MSSLSLALLHHPVLDREGLVVTTAITNLDLHDLARSARTYGLSSFFVVHPVAAQRLLAERIREHWVHGSGRLRIPDRGEALELLRIVPSLADAVGALGGRSSIELWTTAAAARGGATTTYAEARRLLDATPQRRRLLLFGTGWGLAEEILSDADVRLEPIVARALTGYNHLSVRAAGAITLDRLLG